MFVKKNDHFSVVDIHCHILPGVDDGAKDMEESMSMLSCASEEGITDIIATPHYKVGRNRVRSDRIEGIMAEVKKEARLRGIRVRLYLGCELLYFSEAEDYIEEGRIRCMADSDFLLVEFLPRERYAYIKNALYNLRTLGITPIIAHIERYECFAKSPELCEEIFCTGAEIQVDSASILGSRGLREKKTSKYLLDRRMVSFVSTDAHDADKRAPKIRKCAQYLYKKYDREYVDSILRGKAMREIIKCHATNNRVG